MRAPFAAGLALLVLSAVASAAPPTLAPAPSASIFRHAHPRAWRFPVPLAAGLRAAVDPETGTWTSELPATAADAVAQQAEAARQAALARLQAVTRADGSRYVRLDGLVRAYTVVHVGPDGRLDADCVESGPEALRSVLSAPVPRTAPAIAPAGEER